MSDALVRARQRDEGASAVEYALIVALVATAVIVSVATLGHRLHVVFVAIARALPR